MPIQRSVLFIQKSAGWRDNYRHYTHNFIPGDDHNMDTEEDQLKPDTMGPGKIYINIWLVSNLHGERSMPDFSLWGWFRLQVGGYATMPPGGGATDGIVVGGFEKFCT